jgi:NAD(P)-dependent dehydrogenase (short-subunit alcohol dehydrogenase family)
VRLAPNPPFLPQQPFPFPLFQVYGLPLIDPNRVVAQCQSAISEALLAFHRIDVLLICQSEALIGSIEELSQSARALSLVRDQFETNFFAPVNLVKAVLPGMRERRDGHIVAITGISE